MSETPPAPSQRFTIAYALTPKKVASFITPSLLRHAALRGIDLVPVDPAAPLPLSHPIPFHCLIHKLHGGDDDWTGQLLDFSAANPGFPVVDHPRAVARIRTRTTMLQAVSQLGLGNVDIPKQILLQQADADFSGLEFPVIAKPLAADGSADSHDMLLIFNHNGLAELKLKLKHPVVLQEFINHGGVVFKVYVVGRHVECVARPSLPDISDDLMKTSGDSLPFSQISNLTPATHNTSNDHFLVGAADLGNADMPPLSFVTDLALRLRQALGLNLFNFDIIRESKASGNRYLIIDINYFPGYAKMPNYESVLTEFFWDVVHHNPNVALQKPQEQ
uniref:Inositol-tetrakisphosphate 1-kinase n=1 Tax=Kalanchoe fedtschenkoi TaxID=63787 RepID=A0A7N0UTN6_KALFE